MGDATDMKLFTKVTVWKNGVFHWEGPNHVVAGGRTRLAQLCIQDSNTLPAYMAIGDDGSETADGATALVGTELERFLATVGRVTNTLKWTGVFGSTIVSLTTVREFGIFDAAVAGVMLARVRPADFVVTSGDIITITWELRFGDAI